MVSSIIVFCERNSIFQRAAAEWIVRNGGKVKFSNSITWLSNYVTLPYGRQLQVTAIDGSGVALTSSGLQHLGIFLHIKSSYSWQELVQS